MAYRVTLQPSGRSFEAAADRTLLESAQDAGLTLPYGCRNGACGACKGKLTAGAVDHGTAQENALSADERAAGMLLTCCAKPLADLSLEVREPAGAGAIPIKTMPCRVEKLQRLADDVMLMTLKLPSNERLQFVAGQYIEFILKDGKRRAFSLANAPHDDNLLELHLRLIPGGSFTEHVFNALHERDILRFEGPLGTFHLDEQSTKPILMVAGGTGFAPLKALIEHALHQHLERPIAFYWGARTRAGLYLPQLPERWAAEHPHIRYVPVLSEPATTDGWTGRTGLAHAAALADIADLSGYQAYVCGAPAMVEAALRDFTAHGLPADQFFADVFSYAAKAEPK